MSNIHFITFFLSLFALHGCGLIAMTITSSDSGVGDVTIVEPVKNLQAYSHITLQPFVNFSDNPADSSSLTYINNKTHDELLKNGIKIVQNGGLHVSGKVFYFANNFRNQQIIVQVILQDEENGRVLGVINISGMAHDFNSIKSVVVVVSDSILEMLKNNRFSGVDNTEINS